MRDNKEIIFIVFFYIFIFYVIYIQITREESRVKYRELKELEENIIIRADKIDVEFKGLESKIDDIYVNIDSIKKRINNLK